MSNPDSFESRLEHLEIRLEEFSRSMSAFLGSLDAHGLALHSLMATHPRHSDAVLALSGALELWAQGSTPGERLEITRAIVHDLEQAPPIEEGAMRTAQEEVLANVWRRPRKPKS